MIQMLDPDNLRILKYIQSTAAFSKSFFEEGHNKGKKKFLSPFVMTLFNPELSMLAGDEVFKGHRFAYPPYILIYELGYKS